MWSEWFSAVLLLFNAFTQVGGMETYVKSSKKIPNIIEPSTVGRIWRLSKLIKKEVDKDVEEVEFESENGKQVEFALYSDGIKIGFDLGGRFNSLRKKVVDVVGPRSRESAELPQSTIDQLEELTGLVQGDLLQLGFDEITEVELEFEGGEEVQIDVGKPEKKEKAIFNFVNVNVDKEDDIKKEKEENNISNAVNVNVDTEIDLIDLRTGS